jgi:hypothetical protein
MCKTKFGSFGGFHVGEFDEKSGLLTGLGIFITGSEITEGFFKDGK